MPRFSSSLRPLVVCFLTASALRADAAAPDPSIVPPGAPKSEFVDDPGFGKDPFFPRSVRRKFVPKATEEPILDPIIPDFIVLKGISVNQDQKLAIINNYTVAPGEEFSLKHNGQTIKVQCLEIKDKSVVISSGGATKEIPLRAGLQ